MPIVSIITPTYNHKNFIGQAIASVLAQTFSDWEMIVVDDASTDQTPLIIEQFCKGDNRIKFIRHSFNWGKSRLADIYNQALESCNGKYIAILEGDDLWPAYKLEVQIPMLESTPEAVLSHGAVGLVSMKEKVKLPKYPWPMSVRENKPLGSALKALLLGENPIYSQTAVIRRKYLTKIGGFQPDDFPSIVVDYPTWMELAFQGEFIFIPKILGYWRRYPLSVSSHYQEQLWAQHIDYTQLFLAAHKEQWPILTPEVQEYERYASCSALLDLSKLKVLSYSYEEAKLLLKKSLRCRKIIFKDKFKILKFLTLWTCILTRINIYKFLLKFYKKHWLYKGF